MSDGLEDQRSPQAQDSVSPLNRFWVRLITATMTSIVVVVPLVRPLGEAKISPTASHPSPQGIRTPEQIPQLSHPWWQELQAKLRENAANPAPSPTVAPWQRPGLLDAASPTSKPLNSGKDKPSASAKAALKLARDIQSLIDAKTAESEVAQSSKQTIPLDLQALPAPRASIPALSAPMTGSPLSLEDALRLAIANFQKHQSHSPLVPLQVSLANGEKIAFASSIPVAMAKAAGKSLQVSPEPQIWQLKGELLPWINRVLAAYDDLYYYQQQLEVLRRHFSEIQALVEHKNASRELQELALQELESTQQLVLATETAWQLRQYELLNLLQMGQRFPVVVSGEFLTKFENVENLATLQAKALQNRLDYWQLQHRFRVGKSTQTFGTKANERVALVMRRPDLNLEGSYQQSLVDFQQARNQLMGLQQEIPQQVARDYRELQQQGEKLAIAKQQRDRLQKQLEKLPLPSERTVQILQLKVQFKTAELQVLQSQRRYLQSFRQLNTTAGLTLETVQIRIESN